MERRIKLGIIFFLFSGSFIFSQSLMNRLRVPITINGKIGIGYDNNFLRLPDQDICTPDMGTCGDDVEKYGITDVSKIGISSTLDSPILKPTVKLIYSPAIIDGKTTNIITSISYSHFIQAAHKSYHISNVSIEMKLRSYSWFKFGIRDIPRYYLRNYHDRDDNPIDYFECTFSSQKYFVSYSMPIKSVPRTWMKIYSDFTKEYFDTLFTEFDFDKYMIKIDMNHRLKSKHRMKLSYSHVNADNIAHDSEDYLYSVETAFDKSYYIDKILGEFVYIHNKLKNIDKMGISINFEKREYHEIPPFDDVPNWRRYYDGQIKLWIDHNFWDGVDIRTWYQYRWRSFDISFYGVHQAHDDFVKSYNKHELWIELSFEFITDILY